MKLRVTLLALPIIVLADDVKVTSINLKGWQGCSGDQKAKISSGWEGAIKMASSLKDNFNINEAAAVEFFGPPVYSSQYQEKIKKVFENTATFGQGSKWTPTPFKWDAYVRCDDWRRLCGKVVGAAAYTANRMGDPNGNPPRSDSDHDRSTMIINFCNRYFNYPSLKEKIAEVKNDNDYIKFNLDWYRANRDYIILHELMHADVVVYKQNGNKRILDYRFSIKEDRNWKKAYGAANVKLFARIREVFDGDYVTQNADNFAQYALAKAVQKALGNRYPHLPHALRGTLDDKEKFKPSPIPSAMQIEDGRLVWTPDVDNIIFGQSFGVYSSNCPVLDDADGNPQNACGDIIQFSEMLNDTMYPEEYIQQRNAWLEEFANIRPISLPPEPTGQSPVPKNPSQRCTYDPTYNVATFPINSSFAREKLRDACGLFSDISLDANKQKEIIMPYETTSEEIYVWAAWNAGDPACVQQGSDIILERHCIDVYNTIVNTCPSNVDTVTYGGSQVDNCIVYGFDTDKKFTLEYPTR